MSHPSDTSTSADDFDDFFRRVRMGDESAARELVQKYESVIRREARMMTEDPRLMRLFDSIDVSQSVFASFFHRCSIGQYDLENIDQLSGLLIRIARNKLASRAREACRIKRDVRRIVSVDATQHWQLESTDPDPCEKMIDDEQIAAVREKLTETEWRLLEMRMQGYRWSEIAQKLGGTAHARRIQLTRALAYFRETTDRDISV